jgi:hypothetical protein
MQLARLQAATKNRSSQICTASMLSYLGLISRPNQYRSTAVSLLSINLFQVRPRKTKEIAGTRQCIRQVHPERPRRTSGYTPPPATRSRRGLHFIKSLAWTTNRERDQRIETPRRRGDMSYYGQQQAPVGAPPQQGTACSPPIFSLAKLHRPRSSPGAAAASILTFGMWILIESLIHFFRLPAAGVPSAGLSPTAGVPAAGLSAAAGLPAPAAAATAGAFLHAGMVR